MKKKVFIGWNGENLDIASKVGELIKEHNFVPIIGGGSSNNRFVGDTVIKQMNQSEISIIIIEKVPVDKYSFKLSENVMYEWGYLNSKINDPEKIRVFLVNTDIDDLPSDVKGFWVNKVEKSTYKNDKEKDKVFNEVAKNISEIFLDDISKIKQSNKDKLQYLVHWDEYKHEIYNFNGDSQISEKLLYGMQGAIYSNETEFLIYSLRKSQSNLSKVRNISTEANSIINCVCSMLSVFNKSNRLTKKLSKSNYIELIDSLEFKYESNIDDVELKTWCEILRKDKLQLCHQYAADSFDNPKKYLEKSLSQGLEVIDLINKQLTRKPIDEYFAALYLSFQYRNISEIYHRLFEILPEEYSLEDEKKYRELTCEKRNDLRQYYKQTYGDDMVFDNLLQEYILSLIEYYPFVDDNDTCDKICNTVQSLIIKWREDIERRNFVFNAINDKATAFMNLGEN